MALWMLIVASACTSSHKITGSWTEAEDLDCDRVHVHVEDAHGTVYADENDACGFCLDSCADRFEVEVPDGARGITVTTQAFELGDDADDHPPPTTFSIAGPVHDDVDIGMVPM
jgi:hypothetical protein